MPYLLRSSVAVICVYVQMYADITLRLRVVLTASRKDGAAGFASAQALLHVSLICGSSL